MQKFGFGGGYLTRNVIAKLPALDFLARRKRFCLDMIFVQVEGESQGWGEED